MKDESQTDMDSPPITTIAVGALPPRSSGGPVAFRIPAYQRGYRWKTDDVTKLLQDLNDFITDGNQEGNARPFYCIQPLVVKKSEKYPSQWEVVDGQQRLTTLFLIWKSVNGAPPYELSYETRERSRVFLNSPNAEEKNENIDFHHIFHAYQAVEVWFDVDDRKARFQALLADTNPNSRNVRFIWYELQEKDDAVAAFTRLNVGKIPLTDEELIRALFLSSREAGKLADGAFQHRLAVEWERIETALQEPDFWGFVSKNPDPEGGRIRLLFELCAPPDPKEKGEDRHLFTHYHERLTGSPTGTPAEAPADVWKEIVACFEQLEEWYRDPERYHLIGYVITILGNGSPDPLRKLLDAAKEKGKTKNDFMAHLRKSIRTELIGNAEAASIADFVEGLSYSTATPAKQTLALFNIATILRTKGVQIRFPFHLYHNTEIGWDIEHIQSQAGDGLGGKPRQEKWLAACKAELAHDAAMPSPRNEQEGAENEISAKVSPVDLLAEIEEFAKLDSTMDFPELEKKIRRYFSEMESKDEEINSIGNLTLLDAPTNRGYGNAPFVVKRAEILRPERPDGTFILPCARDLFLKVFSENPGNLRRWDIKKDGAAHKAAICETLETFFRENGGAKS